MQIASVAKPKSHKMRVEKLTTLVTNEYLRIKEIEDIGSTYACILIFKSVTLYIPIIIIKIFSIFIIIIIIIIHYYCHYRFIANEQKMREHGVKSSLQHSSSSSAIALNDNHAVVNQSSSMADSLGLEAAVSGT